MPRPSRNKQLFALPDSPPGDLAVDGVRYRLVRVFKHDFFAATCLYEAAPGQEARFPEIVVKIGRTQRLFGLPMRWAGRGLRDHEEAIYRAVAGVGGTPRWVGRIGETGCAIEFLHADPLDHLDAPPAGFFERLRAIFDAIHDRGVAYCDANKRSNILVGPDGEPYLVDFQLAFRRRDDLPWPLRSLIAAAVRHVCHRDLYHLYKHKRRLAPHELTPEQDALSRRRGGLHLLHRKLGKHWRNLRRWFLRKQHETGRLESPSADLEDHHQPEKATWRTPGPDAAEE